MSVTIRDMESPTPLVRILALTDLLGSSPLNAQQQCWIDQLKKAGLELEDQIQEVIPPKPPGKSVVVLDAVLKDLVPRYLQDNLADAGSMEQALQLEDFETIETIGHRMSEVAQSYGFSEISEIGELLEIAAERADPVAVRQQLEALWSYLEKVEIRYE